MGIIHVDGLKAILCIVCAFYAIILSNRNAEEEEHYKGDDDMLNGPCTIPLEVDLSCEKFIQEYMGIQPVIIRPSASSILGNEEFISQSMYTTMKDMYGDLQVDMSTANSYTGKEWTTMSVKEYMTTQLHQINSNQMGNETFYLFGSTHGIEWNAFLQSYQPPTLIYPSESFSNVSCISNILSKETMISTTLSFGIAGHGTGVPFHFHGPGFLQQIHGRKRWFLYPPKSTPLFHPDHSTLHWFQSIYPTMHAPPTHECVLEPRDIIYFPKDWMHATLNLSPYTVFIATFA